MPIEDIKNRPNAAVSQVKLIAIRHRSLLLTLALLVIAMALFFVLDSRVAYPIVIATQVVAMCSVYSLASLLHRAAAPLFLALLMFVPFLNLLVLFLLDQKAKHVLERNEIKVGFLGADISKIP